jgi:hypothetical protein
MTCSQGSFTDIDFSKHTLLLASGTSKIYGFSGIWKRFVKIEEMYILDVGLFNNWSPPATKWVIAVVTEKMTDKDILLHVVVN